MHNGKTILCVIPARAGSKGLAGKNTMELCGKPLIGYTIEQALASRYIDRVVISTEDSSIADIAKRYGAEVPFTRPKDLAADEASTIDVLLHAIDYLEKNEGYSLDILLLLHVTAPLRTVEDIDGCIEMLAEKEADSVFSVTEAHRNPYFNMVEIREDGTAGLVREGTHMTRQSAPKVFDMNASIYAWRKDAIVENRSVFQKRSYAYVMPKERSVDIDDEIDFKLTEMLMREAAGGTHN